MLPAGKGTPENSTPSSRPRRFWTGPPGRVCQLLRAGDLEGEDGDAGKPWRVYAWSVHAYRDATRGGARERWEGTAATSPRAPQESPDRGPDMLRVVQPPARARTLRGTLRADGASGVYGPRGPGAREGQGGGGAGAGGRRTREGGGTAPRAGGGAVEGVLGPAVRRLGNTLTKTSKTTLMHAFGKQSHARSGRVLRALEKDGRGGGAEPPASLREGGNRAR